MDKKIVELQAIANQCKEGRLGRAAALKKMWPLLGYCVEYDRSDLQCGPSPYIYVGKLRFALWHQNPEELLVFVTDVFRRLGQRISVTESLRHWSSYEASCVLSIIRNEVPGSRVYRGLSKHDAKGMNEARCDAMFQVLFLALSQDMCLNLF